MARKKNFLVLEATALLPLMSGNSLDYLDYLLEPIGGNEPLVDNVIITDEVLYEATGLLPSYMREMLDALHDTADNPKEHRRLIDAYSRQLPRQAYVLRNLIEFLDRYPEKVIIRRTLIGERHSRYVKNELDRVAAGNGEDIHDDTALTLQDLRDLGIIRNDRRPAKQGKQAELWSDIDLLDLINSYPIAPDKSHPDQPTLPKITPMRLGDLLLLADLRRQEREDPDTLQAFIAKVKSAPDRTKREGIIRTRMLNLAKDEKAFKACFNGYGEAMGERLWKRIQERVDYYEKTFAMKPEASQSEARMLAFTEPLTYDALHYGKEQFAELIATKGEEAETARLQQKRAAHAEMGRLEIPQSQRAHMERSRNTLSQEWRRQFEDKVSGDRARYQRVFVNAVAEGALPFEKLLPVLIECLPPSKRKGSILLKAPLQSDAIKEEQGIILNLNARPEPTIQLSGLMIDYKGDLGGMTATQLKEFKALPDLLKDPDLKKADREKAQAKLEGYQAKLKRIRQPIPISHLCNDYWGKEGATLDFTQAHLGVVLRNLIEAVVQQPECGISKFRAQAKRLLTPELVYQLELDFANGHWIKEEKLWERQEEKRKKDKAAGIAPKPVEVSNTVEDPIEWKMRSSDHIKTPYYVAYHKIAENRKDLGELSVMEAIAEMNDLKDEANIFVVNFDKDLTAMLPDADHPDKTPKIPDHSPFGERRRLGLRTGYADILLDTNLSLRARSKTCKIEHIHATDFLRAGEKAPLKTEIIEIPITHFGTKLPEKGQVVSLTPEMLNGHRARLGERVSGKVKSVNEDAVTVAAAGFNHFPGRLERGHSWHERWRSNDLSRDAQNSDWTNLVKKLSAAQRGR